MTEQEKNALRRAIRTSGKTAHTRAPSFTHRAKSTRSGLCWQRTKLVARVENEIGEGMKVLDEHILEYIWDETLDRIAQRTLVTYIGGSVGTYSDERAAKDAESFSILSVSQLIAGSGLSESQFRRRVKKLMAQGILLQRIGPNSFVINSEVIKDVAVQAARCWRAIGVPYGMDDTGKACKTLPINALPRSIFELKTNCYRILRSQYPTY